MLHQYNENHSLLPQKSRASIKTVMATAFCDSFNNVLSNIPLRTALCHLTLLREQRETTRNSEFLTKIAIFRLFTLRKDVTVCHTLILDVEFELHG